MELSALLTKKAALIGGGTAATTTAVVVPVAVTQSNRKEGIERKTSSETGTSDTDKGSDDSAEDYNQGTTITPKPITPSLPPKNTSIIKAFNSPSECITRSFPGIEVVKENNNDNEKGFFSRPDDLTNKEAIPISKYGPVDFTASDKSLSNITFGCLTFSKDKEGDNKEFRLEVAVRNDSWGWIWMSGLQKKSSNNNQYELYYREAAVHLYQGNWSLWIGADGKFDVTDTEIAPKFTSEDFTRIEPKEVQECDSSNANCTKKEFRSLLWVPNTSSNKNFLPDGGDWEKSILALKTDENDLKYNKDHNQNKRSGVFGNGIWHPSDAKQTNTVTFKKSILENKKGNWKDLIDYCNNVENHKTTKSIYQILCL